MAPINPGRRSRRRASTALAVALVVGSLLTPWRAEAAPEAALEAARAGGCTLTGTPRSDVLRGGPGRDVICGLGGNDRLDGRGGNDVLRGGAGRDVLLGGAGADDLIGGAGADALNGHGGGDLLSGGGGDDLFTGGAGDDTLRGRDSLAFRDVLRCGPGGADRAFADPPDVVAASCEDVAQNGPPSDLTLTPSFVAENEPVGTVVGELAVTDPDAGDTHVLALVDGDGAQDNASFSVDGATLLTAETLDAEADADLAVRVRATDGAGATYEESLSVSVIDVDENTAPTAVDDGFPGVEDTVLELPLSGEGSPAANDTDADGDSLSVTAVADAAGGTVVITGGSIEFHPDVDLCDPGTGGFDYTVSDGRGGTDLGRVTVDLSCVPDDPSAADDAATVTEDAAATAIPVLGNDSDPDGGPITITSATDPANGAVVVTGEGAGLTYEPTADYCNDPSGTGPDTFTYTLDGGSTATVSMTVTCVDDDPVAVDDAVEVNQDASAAAVDVLANDADVDGGPMSISSAADPANGTVTLTGGTPGAHTGLTYAPDPSYCNNPPGTDLDTFTYTLNGGSTATVSVTVTCDDEAPTAVPDSATVTEDAAAAAVDVLANDTDSDGGPMTIASASDPGNGTVTLTGGSAGAHAGLTYEPGADYCNDPPGTDVDTFTYTLNGGSTATVSVTVTCVDDDPVAVDDAATVTEDGGAAAVTVLGNDTDVDGGGLVIASASDPANGTVVLTGGSPGAHAGLTYEPDADYCNEPPGPVPDDAPDVFTYTVNGGSTATVSMTVDCVNDAPVADDETFDGDDSAIGNTVMVVDDPVDGAPSVSGPGTTVPGSLLDGDADVDGPGPLTVTPGTFATNDGGSVTIQADGDFTFQPAPATSCTDTSDFFDYTVEDSGSPEQTDVGRVTVSIAGCVWYVSNNAAGNAGTSTEPFDTLAQAETASGNDHTVFVFDGDDTSTGYATGYQLDAGERLIGEHEGLVVDPDQGGVLTEDTLFAAVPGAKPTLTATDEDVISLDDANEVRGFVLDPAGTGGGVAGGAGDTGGATLDDLDLLDTGSPGTRPGLELDGTTGTFHVSNLVVSNGAVGVRLDNAGTAVFAPTGQISITSAGARGLDVTGTDLGTSTFDTVTVTGSGSGGVSMVNTTGTTTFTDLALTTTSGSAGAFVLNGAGVVAVPAAGTATVSATGGPAVDVTGTSGASLSFDDVDSSGSAGDGVDLAGLGAGTFSAGAASSITGAAGTAFDLAGGSGDVTFAGAVTDGSGQTAEVTGRTGGTVTLSGPLTDGADAGGGVSVSSNTGGSTVLSGPVKSFDTGAGHGVALSSNAGHAVSVTGGGLDVTTSSGSGLAMSGGGTLDVTGADNAITTTTGPGLVIDDSTIGAGNVTFESVSTNGAAVGIRASNTGALGRLVVTGAGGTCTAADTSGCTGGEIADGAGPDTPGATPTGTGIVLHNTVHPSLTRMWVHDHDNYGIRGTSVVGFTLTDSVINATSGTNGTSALTVHKEGSVRFEELTGTVSVTNTAISHGYFTNLMVDNTAGVLDGTFDNVDSGTLDAAGGDDAVQFEGTGPSEMNIDYRNSTVTTASGDLFQYIGDGTGGGDLDLTGNTFSNDEPSIATGGGGVALVGGAKGAVTMDVLNNTMRDARTNALTIIKSRDSTAGTNNLVANIANNAIGLAATVDSGSLEGDGMEITTFGDGNATFNVTDNTVRQYNSSGMQFVAGSGLADSGQFNLNISGNTIGNPGTNALITLLQGIRVDSGVTAGDAFATCVNFGPNSVVGSSDAANKDFRLVASQSTTLRQPGYAGAATDGTAFAGYAAGRIGGGAQGTAVANAPATFSGAGASCP